MRFQNAKGQMAIFFVLIFQVLFILFGMTLHVALAVHDKINMQNSLDLAAYYGAKKQAEVLNVIAHINYQMRQNYKLLAWRYRILGSLTVTGSSPSPAWCPEYSSTVDACKPSNTIKCPDSIYTGYCDNGFSVCISESVWEKGAGGANKSNLCQTVNVRVPTIRALPAISVLPFSHSNQRLQENLKLGVEKVCAGEAGLSWFVTQLFLTHFRLDQKDRRMMIEAIYNNTLAQGRDLDGNLISEGAEKVFRKNLSYTNLKNYNEGDLSFFNSFNDVLFTGVFTPLPIFPFLLITDLYDSCSGSITTHTTEMPKNKIPTEDEVLLNLFEVNRTPFGKEKNNPLTNLILGFKKTNNVTAYYGVKINLTQGTVPQLFNPTPQDPTEFRGSSFAKAFGGRIGPDEKADPLIFPQIQFMRDNSGKSEVDIKDLYNLQPNHSRYPGDKWGLLDRNLHDLNQKQFFLKKTTNRFVKNLTPYDIKNFIHVNDPRRADALSWTGGKVEGEKDRDDNPLHFLRMMELAAIAPDVFDITHYSILNNYMEAYFQKVCDLIGGGKCQPNQRNELNFSKGNIKGFVRGDFGFPSSKIYRDENKKIGIYNAFVPYFLFAGKFKNDFLEAHSRPDLNYPYLAQDPAHFLTSWAPTTNLNRYNNYSFPDGVFAKCFSKSTDKHHIPSGCAEGGRSGYSVKLTSCSRVQTLEPKVPNLNEYCR